MDLVVPWPGDLLVFVRPDGTSKIRPVAAAVGVVCTVVTQLGTAEQIQGATWEWNGTASVTTLVRGTSSCPRPATATTKK